MVYLRYICKSITLQTDQVCSSFLRVTFELKSSWWRIVILHIYADRKEIKISRIISFWNVEFSLVRSVNLKPWRFWPCRIRLTRKNAWFHLIFLLRVSSYQNNHYLCALLLLRYDHGRYNCETETEAHSLWNDELCECPQWQLLLCRQDKVCWKDRAVE